MQQNHFRIWRKWLYTGNRRNDEPRRAPKGELMANKFDIDPNLVKKIADLLNETGLTEIEFESTGKRIRVVKATTLHTD